tara:strand:- start:390 stop:1274 length:885 start_codon:yes stop_codon:yes gene_type:complete
MSKILILGSKGQVGKCLCEQIDLEANEVISTSRDELDITNKNMLYSTITKNKPNVIINATGYTKVDLAEDNYQEANKLNNIAVSNIAKFSKEIGALFIHISTDYVFDGSSDNPYDEKSDTNPIGVYGKTKLLGENEIILSNCKYIILRTSWVFSEYGNNFLKTIIKLAKVKNHLKVIEDQFGSPTYARDIAAAIISLIDFYKKNKFKSEIIHFSGDKKCSWYFFAKSIVSSAKNYGLNVTEDIYPINTKDFSTKAKRPKNSVLSNLKINSKYNIKSSDWMAGVDKSIEFLTKEK